MRIFPSVFIPFCCFSVWLPPSLVQWFVFCLTYCSILLGISFINFPTCIGYSDNLNIHHRQSNKATRTEKRRVPANQTMINKQTHFFFYFFLLSVLPQPLCLHVPQGRLQISRQGEVTLSDLRLTDSGVFRVEMAKRKGKSSTFVVLVLPGTDLTSAGM